jgi:hypothetical protein
MWLVIWISGLWAKLLGLDMAKKHTHIADILSDKSVMGRLSYVDNLFMNIFFKNMEDSIFKMVVSNVTRIVGGNVVIRMSHSIRRNIFPGVKSKPFAVNKSFTDRQLILVYLVLPLLLEWCAVVDMIHNNV